MSADNAVLLFILVWTFMTVCQADYVISVSCENVTGSAGKEVNLTCSVSLQNIECCIAMYKFQYSERFNDSAICPQEFPMNPCEQRNSFTCRYTPTTAMTEQFRFYLQTKCGRKMAKFTVDVKESSLIIAEDSEETGSKNAGSKNAVITSVVGLSVIIILIILMTIICKMQSFRFQRRMFLCIRHGDDNSNYPESVI